MDDIEFHSPNEKLPAKGQRVVTLVIKEMTYGGIEDGVSSFWHDDGEGVRAILSWADISHAEEIKSNQKKIESTEKKIGRKTFDSSQGESPKKAKIGGKTKKIRATKER